RMAPARRTDCWLTGPCTTATDARQGRGSAVVTQKSEVQISTASYKIEMVGRWLREHGATPENPATVGIGISLDEIHRVNNRRAMPYERPVYPLLDHTPPLRRSDCHRIITAAGLPVPPKSACWFCPLKRPDTFATMRRDRPDLFAKACQLETLLNTRRAALG